MNTSPQAEIVKEIPKKIISNLQERFTIEKLSKEYIINTAALKAKFKGIFGAAFRDVLKIIPTKYQKQNASEQDGAKSSKA